MIQENKESMPFKKPDSPSTGNDKPSAAPKDRPRVFSRNTKDGGGGRGGRDGGSRSDRPNARGGRPPFAGGGRPPFARGGRPPFARDDSSRGDKPRYAPKESGQREDGPNRFPTRDRPRVFNRDSRDGRDSRGDRGGRDGFNRSDRPNTGGGRPPYAGGGRPPYAGGGRPPYAGGGRPSFAGGGRPPFKRDDSFRGDKPRYAPKESGQRGDGSNRFPTRDGRDGRDSRGGRGGFNRSDRPDRPNAGGGRPPFAGGGRPPYAGGGRPSFAGGGRPPFKRDDSFRGDKPRYAPKESGQREDRPNRFPTRDGRDGFNRSDRPNAGGGRPSYAGGGRPPFKRDDSFRGDKPRYAPKESSQREDRPNRFPTRDGRGGRDGFNRSDRPDRPNAGGGRPPYAGGGRPPFKRDDSFRGDKPRYAPKESGQREDRPNRFPTRDGSRDGRGGRDGFNRSDRPNAGGGRPPFARDESFRDDKPEASQSRRPSQGKTISKWVNLDNASPQANRGDNSDVKLQKMLACAGLGSRRKMEALIESGVVTVNDKVATLGQRVSSSDKVCVNNEHITVQDIIPRWLAYYKPVGTIVENNEGIESVFDDLPQLEGGRWVSVGRLDVATEGLLLFSTDSNWVHQQAHPSNGHEREYRVRADKALNEDSIADILNNGIVLDGKDLVRPSHFALEVQGEGTNCWYRIILGEGKNRVVRRIFESVDIGISRLIRVRFGHFHLPESLKPGEYKELYLDKSK